MINGYSGVNHSRVWHDNPAVVQWVAVSPLLALGDSVATALAVGLTTLLTTTVARVVVSSLRSFLLPATTLLVALLILATLAGSVELLMQAYAHSFYQDSGILLPLLISNCALLHQADSFTRPHTPLAAMRDGLLMGNRFLLAIVLVAALRELLGTGSLFAGLDQLLPLASNWRIEIFATQSPFLLLLSPPGAFLLLGVLIALLNVIYKGRGEPVAAEPLAAPRARRARVTGKV